MTSSAKNHRHYRPSCPIFLMRRIPTNGNLYHYGGNNPVKYTDPDGRDITNDTDEYILGKLEEGLPIEKDENSEDIKRSFIIIAPGETVKGHFDGAIMKDGTIVKVSAESKFNENVNFVITKNNDNEFDFFIPDYSSFCTDKKNNDLKGVWNSIPFFKKLDYSGKYLNQNLDGADLNNWWKNAISSNECNTPENWNKENLASEQQKILRSEVQKKWGAK